MKAEWEMQSTDGGEGTTRRRLRAMLKSVEHMPNDLKAVIESVLDRRNGEIGSPEIGKRITDMHKKINDIDRNTKGTRNFFKKWLSYGASKALDDD